jgi:hypothetical protein
MLSVTPSAHKISRPLSKSLILKELSAHENIKIAHDKRVKMFENFMVI